MGIPFFFRPYKALQALSLFILFRTFANMKLSEWKLFLEKDLWRIQPHEVGKWRMLGYGTLKRTILTIECFIRQQLYFRASALTYSTLFATIPILAIVFAISRGFGFNKLIEEQIRKNFQAQPQVIDDVIGFVNSYLVHTRSGIFIGFGLILLFWTLISLTTNIEETFNEIWQVKRQRSPFRQLTDYTAVFLLLPLFIVITSGLSLFVSTFAQQLPNFLLLGSFMQFCIKVSPFLLTGLLFTGLYMFMPNTQVKVKSAAKAGFLAGTAFQLLLYFYIHSQLWVSSYNAIYGSFAALPLFMLLLQISWYICLFGAELSYVDQHIDNFFHGKELPSLSRRYHDFLCVLIMSLICKRFSAGKRPYTADKLAHLHRIPIRLVNDILFELCSCGMLLEVGCNDEKGASSTFVPARDTSSLTLGVLIAALSKHGYEDIKEDLPESYRSAWKQYTTSHKQLIEEIEFQTRLVDL